MIPGDGIGPEVTGAAVRIIENAGVKIDWESFKAGSEAFEKYREYIPKELIESIERTGLALKGPITTPIGGGFASINVTPRCQLAIPKLTWSSFARTPKANTQALNTRSFQE